MLDNVHFILSHTTEPMNIGAAARAMKNMGLRNMTLINPRDPHGERARVMAHASEDVLDRARIVTHANDALRNMVVVAGTTARRRELRKWSFLSPRECAERLVADAAQGPVAVMFGSERMGLTNDEINACRHLSLVDTSDAQSSLNLAQAVMVYAYEIRRAWLRTQEKAETPAAHAVTKRATHPHRSTKLPTQFELDTMYEHMGTAMKAVGYSDFERNKFLTFMRQMHMRAGMVDWEMQIYHLFARKVLRAVGAPAYRPGARDDAEDDR